MLEMIGQFHPYSTYVNEVNLIIQALDQMKEHFSTLLFQPVKINHGDSQNPHLQKSRQ